MRRAANAILFALVGLLAAGAAAWAQQAKKPSRPLHEDLPSPSASGGGASPWVGSTPRSGQNPQAFAAGDNVLPEPELAPRASSEPVFGRDGFATDRDTSQRPDYDTRSDGTLHYVSVFNPDVMPFKRMTALDGVADDYAAVIRGGGFTDLPIGGATDHTRDRFWASIMIELAPGRDVAIPSVAPDMRILSYEIQPAVQLSFRKDSADNFVVRADQGSAGGQYRLVFLADADAGYFAPQLPRRPYTIARVRDLASRQGLLPALPPAVLAMARKALVDRGLSDSSDLADAFNKLVYYFRSFEAKTVVTPTGDIFWDLYRNQAGVCRHRASTFMITANALGIPTRLVTNEAHAFVEVWFPDREWQRVDLGGAALRLEVQNAADKAIHRPRADDPFAKPAAYDQGYTQLEGDIGGLSGAQLDAARKPAGEAPASGDWESVLGDGSHAPARDGVLSPNPDPRGRPIDPSKITPAVATTLTDSVGYRGEVLRVDGRVDAGAAAVPGVRVDVMVVPARAANAPPIAIGRGVTAADGTFSIEAEIPVELELSEYEIYAATPEDARYNAAISD